MSATITPLFTPVTSLVHIAADGASLVGELTVPFDARGLAVFAYTYSGSLAGRDRRRLARSLHEQGYATLSFDLLTPDEEMIDAQTRRLSEDLPLLARRLIETIDWLADHDATAHLPVGLIGDGSGATAAFVAACVRPHRVAALVSYAEAPDLTSPVLGRVQAPALLIVRGDSEASLRANDNAFRRLHGVRELVRLGMPADAKRPVVDEVSRLLLAWFDRHLSTHAALRAPADDLC